MSCHELVERVRAFDKVRADFKESQTEQNRKIGRIAKAARVEAGLSVRKLADRMGVSHTMVGAWENGSSFWFEGIAEKYAKALEASE